MNDNQLNKVLEVVTVTLNPAIDQTISIRDFAVGEVNRVEEVQSVAGGKGVNVASVLSDAGHAVAATGFLGADNTQLFEALCSRKSILDRFVRIQGQTRTGIKIIDPVQGSTTDINFPGLVPTQGNLESLYKELSRLQAKWYVLAGSVPPGIDAGIYRELSLMLKEQGAKVALDTSGEPLKLALDAAPNLIKPNIDELQTLVGEELPTRETVIQAAQRLVKQGIEIVVVSMGAEGACVVSEQQVLMAYPPNVQVKSTVGAGDAMVAGFVAGQLRSVSLDANARLATAFSLDALSRLEAGLSPMPVVAKRMNDVRIENLEVASVCGSNIK